MTITETNNGEAIELAITGRVDTLTSRELQDTIIAAFQKKKNVILNFASVEYISSAGLRALLLGHKTALSKGGKMTVTHINKTVKDILKISGFYTMLSVEE